ncbi:hypothetical protein SAMN04487996_13355 [Dyadobacter soli]|uniref:Uncharacterized protein n=1 Tax=Dyadobacter soli TaxID=659014 RepID=A0A1G8BK71_9BACT|nr:hypothetical protein [Dyadobacter soli]SDH33538.1 hypothetical protein SAMN04487996_13355 [Dyadobacter soli]
MKNIIVYLALCVCLLNTALGQIKIENIKNSVYNSKRGFYIVNHLASTFQSEVPTAQRIDQLIREDSLDMGSKTYRFATPMKVDVDFLQAANWLTRGSIAYGRLLIVASVAKSMSLNFDSFVIPNSGELVVYNSRGTIAGPMTSEQAACFSTNRISC